MGLIKGLVDEDTGVARNDARILEEVVVGTSVDETIDLSVYTYVVQVASGITTSFSNFTTGTKLKIKNRSGGTNTLNITINENVSPDIFDGEGFNLIFNSIDWDLL